MRDLVTIFLEAITDETIHDHGLIPPRVVHGAKSVIEALNKDAEEAHVTILLSNLGKVYNLLRQGKKIKITNRTHVEYDRETQNAIWHSKAVYMFANPPMNKLLLHLENGQDVDAEINLLDCMYLFRDKVEEYVEEPKFDYIDVVIEDGLYVVKYKGKRMKLSEALCMVNYEDITSVDERGNELITRFWPIGGVKKHTPKKVKFRV